MSKLSFTNGYFQIKETQSVETLWLPPKDLSKEKRKSRPQISFKIAVKTVDGKKICRSLRPCGFKSRLRYQL